MEEVGELEGEGLAGVPDEGDIDHRLSAIPGCLPGAHPLGVGSMPVDGQVLAEEVDVIERGRRRDQL